MRNTINDDKNKKNKITPEMAIEINGIEYDKEKYKTRPLFFEALGKQFGISQASVRIIKSTKLDNKANVQGVERLRRLTLIKPVTEAIAKQLVTAMYEEYFNKKPDYLSAIDRYGVMQIVIRPEMIFFQIDERHLTNLERFTQMATYSFKDAVSNYESNVITRKKREGVNEMMRKKVKIDDFDSWIKLSTWRENCPKDVDRKITGEGEVVRVYYNNVSDEKQGEIQHFIADLLKEIN